MNTSMFITSLQQRINIIDAESWNPNYIVAIISGVVLAIAFQLILTALSVACGITAIGDLKKKYVKNRLNLDEDKNAVKEENEYSNDTDTGTPTAVKITTGFGIWSLITTSISLFAATAIALNFSLFGLNAANIAAGLVIWALFFILLFYMEMKIGSTIIGGLASTALSSFRTVSSKIKQTFETSDADKIDKVIDTTITKVRSEFDKSIDTSNIEKTIAKFFNKIEKKTPSYDQLIKDLESIASKSTTEVNQKASSGGTVRAIEKMIEKFDNDDSNKGKVEKLKSLLATVKERYNEGDDAYDSITNVITEVSDIDQKQIDDQVQKIESYLQTGDESSLDADNIKTQLSAIISNPSKSFNDIRKRFDKKTIIDLLDKNTSIEKSKIEKYAALIEDNIGNLRSTFTSDNSNDSSLQQSIESKIHAYLDSTGREELNYNGLKADLMKALNNPNESLSIIKNRIGMMDKQTLRALLTSSTNISDGDIDKVVDKIEEAKTDTLSQIKEIEKRANRKIENLKRKAVIKSENARMAAASASWWLVATSVISALAAIGGTAVTF
ncbi:hypothetical protein ACXGQW_05455 [Wenyingzhuangia sp. IMCC45533]